MNYTDHKKRIEILGGPSSRMAQISSRRNAEPRPDTTPLQNRPNPAYCLRRLIDNQTTPSAHPAGCS